MALMWIILLILRLLCSSSQEIYLNERNDCSNSENILSGLQTVLIKQGELQREIDQQRQYNIEIRELMSNLTLVSQLQYDINQLRRENMEIRDLLSNLSLNSLKVNVDCKDLYVNGYTRSGVYGINPFRNETQIKVFRDMDVIGGGWTAIQKRRSGSVSFYKTWAEYKTGFGNPEDTYWIGNDAIHQLIKGRNSSLYVSITLQNDTRLYQLYHQFSVSAEAGNYRLFLGGPVSGTLGDSMFNPPRADSVLNGASFSTPDRDNDLGADRSCAAVFKGGWWFRNCYSAFLNGPWTGEWLSPWNPPISNGNEIKETVMMVRAN